MKFTEVLFKEVKELWDEYLEHPFVKEIGEGTLSKDKFKNYLIQDYLYLKDYAKVFSMGVMKAKTIEEMKFYYNAMKGVMEDETAVHINYLKEFGLSTEETEKQNNELITSSYANYMIGIALKGDCKEIAMATMPCTWSYYYIGKHLYDTYKKTLDTNFYKPWIEEYSSPGFKECVEEWQEYVNTICSNLNKEEINNLKEIFINSSLYEMEFWNMAYSE